RLSDRSPRAAGAETGRSRTVAPPKTVSLAAAARAAAHAASTAVVEARTVLLAASEAAARTRVRARATPGPSSVGGSPGTRSRTPRMALPVARAAGAAARRPTGAGASTTAPRGEPAAAPAAVRGRPARAAAP